MDALLTTKLNIPATRGDAVLRPRLIQRLQSGKAGKLTLISAPAGFGKTSLARDWALEMGRPVAWITLDEGDNDLTRFASYLAAALRQIEPSTGQNLEHLLNAPKQPSSHALAAALINDITASTAPFALVLDDYHTIEDVSVHEGLRSLIKHQPPHMHLVITTREDPPLALAKLRAQSQLTEVRAQHLRFTQGEAEALLNNLMGLGLSREEVATVAARTEGWAAGLQLAALSLRDQTDRSSAVQAFTGTDRYIMDYLVDEVLSQQPPQVQSFLLQTSILEQLSGPLCDAVIVEASEGGGTEDSGAGRPSRKSTLPPSSPLKPSQAILEYLEGANLFVTPLDNQRSWYRYHALFSDMLRRRLKHAHPELAPVLHSRASSWYERSGQISQAIEHAAAARDFERAVTLVEQAAEAMLIRTENATVLRWVKAIPAEMILSRPRLCVFYAGALLAGGRKLGRIEPILQQAEQNDPTGAISSEAAVIRSLVAMSLGDIRDSIELSKLALQSLPEDNLFLRSLARGNLGVGYLLNGEVEPASGVFEEVVKMGEMAGSYTASLTALRYLAEIAILRGRLHEAWSFCERGVKASIEQQGAPVPLTGILMAVQGELLREWDELEAAEQLLEKSIELVSLWGEMIVIDAYISLARTKESMGKIEASQAALRSAKEVAGQSDANSMTRLMLDLHLARYSLARGDLKGAEGRIAKYRTAKALAKGKRGKEPVHYLMFELEGMVLSRLQIARRQADEALEILGPLSESARRQNRKGSLIQILVLLALAYQKKNDAHNALQSLGEALKLAEPEGNRRTFIDEGRPMAELLYRGASSGISREYCARLLAAFPGAEPVHPTSDALTEALIEPLSEREIEVLRLIDEGASNAEIAQRLYISLNTVKGHTRKVYRKLNVASRTQAAARARALGILPPA